MQIIDDDDAITVFDIPNKVIVEPKDGTVDLFVNELLTDSANSAFVSDISNGDLQLVAKNIISFTSLLNSDSNNGSNESTRLQIKDMFVDKAVGLNVTDVSSIKVLASVFSIITQNTREISYQSAVINKLII